MDRFCAYLKRLSKYALVALTSNHKTMHVGLFSTRKETSLCKYQTVSRLIFIRTVWSVPGPK